MGRLRAAKKSRGHYVAKKGTDKQDSVSTIDLEAISLHTKKQSFITTTSESISRAEKPSVVPHSNEGVKEDDVSPSAEKLGVAKKGISKKDRRAARRQQWMKKLSNYQQPEKKALNKKKETNKIGDMQSLAIALPSLQEIGTSKNKKKAQKFTKKTMDAEINNFVQVLEHPAFKKDPLGTIHLHLTNARKRGLI